MKYTLVSEVHLTNPTGSVRLKDVSVGIEPRIRGGVVIDIGAERIHRTTLALSEAERVALIEALGGVAR